MVGITFPSDRANSHGWPLQILLAFSAQAQLPRYHPHVDTESEEEKIHSKGNRTGIDFNNSDLDPLPLLSCSKERMTQQK